ncbi:MAG TPA: hypothetical protein VGQ39_17725 [Pyrinomonadaceae bacterium]|nr:hypothetical protein [Pyrinomonadaceae bacterium]
MSSDQRTRITLVTRNIDIIAGENIAPPSVEAEDAQHRIFSLPVEHVGRVPGAGWQTQIVVRLPEDLRAAISKLVFRFEGAPADVAFSLLPLRLPHHESLIGGFLRTG